jgi:uncharacterized protein with FMN-binding domain
MKKLKIIASIGAVVVIIIIIGFIVMNKNMNKALETYNNFNYSNLDLSKVEDGVYKGSEDGGLVKASVEVTINDHKISKVTILSHECGKGKPAEAIAEDMVSHNSPDVDVISGATFSSHVIKVAVYNALTNKAE